MPIFTPSRRWQQAFYSFKKRRFSERVEEAMERSIKGILWGCRMCGNCLLQETAFICPMACPKGLRNGPCGGSTPDHCCVDDSRPYIWYAIYERAEKLGRLDKLLEVFPPLDWDKTGTSAVKDVISKMGENGLVKTVSNAVRLSPNERTQKWERFFKEIRQPGWWAGDSLPHPVPIHEPASRLESVLTAGRFAVTCEIVPPLSGGFSSLDRDLMELRSAVDGINITDSPSATLHISPLACAVRAIASGVEPVLQMASRDRTRLSFQADLLGAADSGIRKMLLITGDHPNKGKPPFSRMDIWDYDSIQALWMARKLRDEGIFLDGSRVKHKPNYFIGAAVAPFLSKPKYQALRAEKKINAGAQFFQTNLVYDLPRFEAYLLLKNNINLIYS